MASYLEQLLEVFDEIPEKVTREMRKLREIDEENAKISHQLDEDEKALLATIKEAEADDNFLEKIANLQARRAELDAAMHVQIKASQDIYGLIDQPINTLDQYISDLNDLATRSKNNSRKKRKSDAAEQNIVLAASPGADYVDPNEPIYCFCRRVSYGRMVGCDNDECPIEWFHFDCVGVTEEPTDAWYCSECRPKFVKS